MSVGLSSKYFSLCAYDVFYFFVYLSLCASNNLGLTLSMFYSCINLNIGRYIVYTIYMRIIYLVHAKNKFNTQKHLYFRSQQ
jgi:hypothetical protein